VLRGLVPFSGAQRALAYQVDPLIRRPQTLSENLQAGIPWASKNVEPRLTRWGEPVKRMGGGFNIFEPSPNVHDPVGEAMQRAGLDIRTAQAPAQVEPVKGVRIPLSEQEQFTAAQRGGRLVRRGAEAAVNVPNFQNLPPMLQKELMEKGIAAGRSVEQRLLMRDAIQKELQRRRGAQP